jgi:predicted ATPase/class 3 adenylate cyclase/DNA-binding CsgD family transcriptional regulator
MLCGGGGRILPVVDSDNMSSGLGILETVGMTSPTMPTGAVTFLLTDVEGSTRAWSADPDGTAAAILRHYEILDEAIATHGGYRPVDQGEGDSIVAAFARPSAAVAAALSAQRTLVRELSDVFMVRMALHTGEAHEHDGSYFGQTIIRTARLRACGHGGQILVSRATADMVADRLPADATLVPLGRHRLRDLNRPEEVWQLGAADLRSHFPPLVSLDSFATNLPVAVTALIGRVEELAAIAPLVRDDGQRVVTLTGPGGVGKTRLALQAAADAVDAFPDGVWWVELAPIDRGDRVADTIALAIGIPEATAVSALDQLLAALADKRALIVIDNCEHLVEPCASVADRLVHGCPALTVLATSREPLGTSTETVWRVPSLSMPDESAVSTSALATSDAVRLFVARAKQARASFQLVDANAGAVSEICRRLDGIPLALELAAARARAAPVERVAAELTERFRVLTGGARTLLPRHQTLLASVDWSHDLLSPDEQKLLRRLSVFVASFSAEAAEQVTAGDDLDGYEVLELLGRLVDKSLVQLDDSSGRYHLLETIRQYALGRCRAAGELEHGRDRHAGWALGLIEGVDHDLCDRATIAAFDTDYANIRAALEWVSERDPDTALRMVDGLASYWGLSGRHRDALGLSPRLLDTVQETDPPRWATVVSLLAWVYVSAGDVDFVTTHVLPALEIARAEADVASQARCLYGIGLASVGDSPCFEPVHELASLAGNRRYAVYGALLASGSLLGTREAEPYLQRAWKLSVGFDDETFEIALPGWAALHAGLRGDQTAATALSRQALQHESRAIAAQLTVVACVMTVALQGGDDDLLQLAVRSVPSELRDVPGSEWWIQLLDDAATLLEPGRPPSTLAVPPPLMLVLLASDLVMRVLLTDGRLGEAAEWADLIPPSWPAAHCSARLAQAWIAVQSGDPRAADRIHEALADAAAQGLLPFATEALELLAVHLAGAGHHELSARLLGAGDTARQQAAIVWRYPYHRSAVDGVHERLRDALDADRYDSALRDGALTSLEEAVELAQRRRGRRGRTTHGWESLTPTELSVAREVAAGHTNVQAGERLFIAPSTVKTHLERIYTKLGIRGRAALATEVARHEQV